MASPRIVCAGCGAVYSGSIFGSPLCIACQAILREGVESGEIGADPGIEVGGTTHGEGERECG